MINQNQKELIYRVEQLILDATCINFHSNLRPLLSTALSTGTATVYSVKKISSITVVKLKWLDMEFSVTCGSRSNIRILSTIFSADYLYEVLKNV